MESSVIPPTHSKKPALLIIVLVLLLLGLVYVYGQNKSNSNKKAAVSSDWVEYKSTQYGFKFSYPKEWGPAHIASIADTTGKTYSVLFPDVKTPKIDKSLLVSIKFDTDNMTEKVCSTDNTNVCGSTKGVTSKDIQNVLSSKSKPIERDSSSYATITTAPEMNLQSQLDVNQIIKLGSLNVSAVRGSVSIYGPRKDCPASEFSNDATQQCVSTLDYTNLSKTLKSFKQL